jgi:replicative DNA helicase
MKSFEDKSLAYFGKDYELKVLKNLIGTYEQKGNGVLRDDSFGRKMINKMTAEHFTNDLARRIFVFLKNYYASKNKIPFYDTISSFVKAKVENEYEQEMIFQYLSDIEKVSMEDSEWVQENTISFINTKNLISSWNKCLENYINKGKYDKYSEISEIMTEAIVQMNDEAPLEAFVAGDYRHLEEGERHPIPTGIEALDTDMNGGLAYGEFALVIAPSGIGKTTFATHTANNGAKFGYNVLQIFFEDTVEQIKMKHISKLIGKPINFSSNKKNRKTVMKETDSKLEKIRNSGGCLVPLSMDSTETTVEDIKKVYKRAMEQGVYFPDTGELKKIKFDLVLIDYIDCIKSKRHYEKQWEGQTEIARDLEKLCGKEELNFACWVFTQGTKGSLNTKIVTGEQMGGDFGKYKVAHFVMSFARDLEQQSQNKANVTILKNRMGRAGILYEDCIFDNGNMLIEFNKEEFLTEKTVNDTLVSYSNSYD